MLKAQRLLVEQQLFLQSVHRELQGLSRSLRHEVWSMTERERQIHYLRARVARLDEILNRAEVYEFQRLVVVLSAERDAYRNALAALLKQPEDTSLRESDMGIPDFAGGIRAAPALLSPDEIDSILNPSIKTRISEFLHGLWGYVKFSFSFIPGLPESEELLIQSIQEELRHVSKQLSTSVTNLSDEERERLILQAKILVCEKSMEAGYFKCFPSVLRYAWREKLRYESELNLLDSDQ
jgi:hypothetical protein